MLERPSCVLVLAPHGDDAEWGAGALLSRLLRVGVPVHELVFSLARESMPKELPPDTLASEVRAAAVALGLSLENVRLLDLPVRHMPAHRQEILEELVRVKRTLAPDLVLVPAGTDVHQDHRTVHEEAVRAFKDATVLGYELPWNNISFDARAVFAVDPADLERKVAAIRCYASQARRPYMDPELVRSVARTRGAAIRVPFAEAYEVVRLVAR